LGKRSLIGGFRHQKNNALLSQKKIDYKGLKKPLKKRSCKRKLVEVWLIKQSKTQKKFRRFLGGRYGGKY